MAASVLLVAQIQTRDTRLKVRKRKAGPDIDTAILAMMRCWPNMLYMHIEWVVPNTAHEGNAQVLNVFHNSRKRIAR